MNIKLLSPKTVAELLGNISIATLSRFCRDNDSFPPAVQITKQRIGFRSDLIQKWIEQVSK